MPSSFGHTLRSLEHKPRFGLALLPALLFVGGWSAWMLVARVTVFVSAPQARVEMTEAPSRIATEVSGRVVRSHLELGAWVERGAMLVELDASIARAELAELASAVDVLDEKRSGAEQQLAAERDKRGARLRLGELASARATLDVEHATALEGHQAELTLIAEQLQREQLNSRVEAVSAEGKLRESQIRVADARAQIERLEAEHDYEDKSELARLAELGRHITELAAERNQVLSQLRTAELELAKLRVTAPVSGRVGHIAPLQLGDVLPAGEVIASLVPADDVRVVAFFPPEPAVGRILPGQSARLRLDGFSWTEFGAVTATVSRVASEPHAGLIRVELRASDPEATRAPLEHGMTGALDIRIEEASPLALLLRSVAPELAAPPRAEPELRAFAGGVQR
jgi:multidrug resistance efflux pump